MLIQDKKAIRDTKICNCMLRFESMANSVIQVTERSDNYDTGTLFIAFKQLYFPNEIIKRPMLGDSLFLIIRSIRHIHIILFMECKINLL